MLAHTSKDTDFVSQFYANVLEKGTVTRERLPYVRFAVRRKRISVYFLQYHCSHVFSNLALRKYVRVLSSPGETREISLVFSGDV